MNFILFTVLLSLALGSQEAEHKPEIPPVPGSVSSTKAPDVGAHSTATTRSTATVTIEKPNQSSNGTEDKTDAKATETVTTEHTISLNVTVRSTTEVPKVSDVTSKSTTESSPKSGPASPESRLSPPKTTHAMKPLGPVSTVADDAGGAFTSIVYIIGGLTLVTMSYLLVRNFRMRYAQARVERYGVRRRWRGDQELQPLGRMDDDDEETLFDARGVYTA